MIFQQSKSVSLTTLSLPKKVKAKYQPESSVGNDDLLLPADPVGAELVHHRREQDGDQEPVILSGDSIFIMVMISKVVIRNLE